MLAHVLVAAVACIDDTRRMFETIYCTIDQRCMTTELQKQKGMRTL